MHRFFKWWNNYREIDKPNAEEVNLDDIVVKPTIKEWEVLSPIHGYKPADFTSIQHVTEYGDNYVIEYPEGKIYIPKYLAIVIHREVT